MDRNTQKRIILFKVQTTHGVDPLPTAAANAVLVYDLSTKPLVSSKKERKPVRGFPGKNPSKLADQHIEISFKVELAGSGAAGTAPAVGPLLRTSALAELITAGQKVEYTPIIDSQEEGTFYYHKDGALHKIVDAKGEATLTLLKGDVAMASFRFIGRVGGRVVTANPATPAYTSWKDALIVNDTNTGDLTLGGTAYPSTGFEFSFGNALAFKTLLGKEVVRISDRNPSGKVSLDLTPTEELALIAKTENSETLSLSIAHGTTAGNIVTISAPAAQLLEPNEEEQNGDMMHGFSVDLLPVNGLDEFKITFA